MGPSRLTVRGNHRLNETTIIDECMMPLARYLVPSFSVRVVAILPLRQRGCDLLYSPSISTVKIDYGFSLVSEFPITRKPRNQKT